MIRAFFAWLTKWLLIFFIALLVGTVICGLFAEPGYTITALLIILLWSRGRKGGETSAVL